MGNYLPQIIHNLERFQEIKKRTQLLPGSPHGPEIGIAFALMMTNAADLLEIIDLGKRLGANSFFFTHMEAYSEDIAKEALYLDRHGRPRGNGTRFEMDGWIPRLDEILNIQQVEPGVKISGSLMNWDPICPYVIKEATAVRWVGEISPCLPLLCDHRTFAGNWKHQVFRHSLGNIESRSIREIWLDSDYKNFRARILKRSYSPYLNCRDCWLSEDNFLDCMGYGHPTCGGCLWAQGVIGFP